MICATAQLEKDGKVVGHVMITPKSSTGLLWRNIGEKNWIDSLDIEIDFDSSSACEDTEFEDLF